MENQRQYLICRWSNPD